MSTDCKIWLNAIIPKLTDESLDSALASCCSDKTVEFMTCNDARQIIKVDLNGNPFLTEIIPPEIGQLSAIQELILMNNQLKGPIPPEIGQLSTLTKLILDGNQFTGSIPNELGNCLKLETLSLTGNNLIGGIPASVQNLPLLKTIDGVEIKKGAVSNGETQNGAANNTTAAPAKERPQQNTRPPINPGRKVFQTIFERRRKAKTRGKSPTRGRIAPSSPKGTPTEGAELPSSEEKSTTAGNGQSTGVELPATAPAPEEKSKAKSPSGKGKTEGAELPNSVPNPAAPPVSNSQPEGSNQPNAAQPATAQLPESVPNASISKSHTSTSFMALISFLVLGQFEILV